MATAASRCTLSTLLKDFSSAAPPQSPHAGIALQADLVKPSKSHFPIKQFSCLAFLRVCVGYLHISEVPPPTPHPHLPIVLSRPRHLRCSYLTRPPNPTTETHFGARFQTHGHACPLSKSKLFGLDSQWRTLAERGFKRFHMCPQIQALFRGRDTGLFTAAAHLLGIVRENVTNKQFWVAGEKSVGYQFQLI